MIKAIIFDLDGVLVETKDIHFLALNLGYESTRILHYYNYISFCWRATASSSFSE